MISLDIYQLSIISLHADKVVSGTDERKILPDKPITREQASAIIAIAAGSQFEQNINKNELPSIEVGDMDGTIGTKGITYYSFKANSSGVYPISTEKDFELRVYEQIKGDAQMEEACYRRIPNLPDRPGNFPISVDPAVDVGGKKIIIAVTEAVAGQSKRSFKVTLEQFTPFLTQQEVNFTSVESNHRFIDVDHPEHIRENETLDKGRLLMHLNNLTPGKYTMFALHHKAVASSLDIKPRPPIEPGDQLPNNTRLYYDAVFYNPNGDKVKDNVKINRIGIANSNIQHGWTSFIGGDNNTGYKYDKSPFPQNASDKIWLSDLAPREDEDLYSKLLISDNHEMGNIWIMMEFEVTTGTVNFASMAYILDSPTQLNNGAHKSMFNESLVSSFYDLPQQTIKGIGNFSQSLQSDVMTYYIDGSSVTKQLPDGSSVKKPLPFKVVNKFDTYDNVTLLYTNTSPAYYDSYNRTPGSAVREIEYPGPTSPNIGRTVIFDGYHSPYLEDPYSRFTPNQDIFNWLQERILNGELNTQEINWLNNSTTMAGYGTTQQLRFRIYNASNDMRYLRYQVTFSGVYHFEVYRNGVKQSLNDNGVINVSDDYQFNGVEKDIVSVNLEPNSYTDITISESELSGNATAKHRFFID